MQLNVFYAIIVLEIVLKKLYIYKNINASLKPKVEYFYLLYDSNILNLLQKSVYINY